MSTYSVKHSVKHSVKNPVKHSVKNSELYTSPLVGNGEVVTRLGPTGFHNGFCPEPDLANRVIVWAGRRMNTPTRALIRYGSLKRSLSINQSPSTDDLWEQSLDYDQGLVLSALQHGDLHEHTRSLVCLSENVMIFQTRLHNQGKTPLELCFRYDYDFPDTLDARLNFPHLSHFNRDAEPGSSQESIQLRVLQRRAGVSVQYQIGKELGEVRWQSYPEPQLELSKTGASFSQTFRLEPGQERELWCWLMLSDRRKFTHFPDLDRLQTLIQEHQQAWKNFWSQSWLEFEDPRLTDLRQSCLYGIRCNASPWSIPPNYAPSYWEGRSFHDELYPFLALLSGGYVDLARRIPRFRLNTLPQALEYGGGEAARFPWEATETGEEGGPYGPWLDERFHIGQISETAWRYYLYSQDLDDLRTFYPLLCACATMFVQDVLIRDDRGNLSTRRVTDFDEVIYPVSNGIFTISAAIRSLENAAMAAHKLELDIKRRQSWEKLAQELRAALPQQNHPTQQNRPIQASYYKAADDAAAQHWHIAQLGPIYPFAIDVHSELAQTTLSHLHKALATQLNVTAGTPESYQGSHWMWAAAMMATAYFLQGRGDEGYQLLAQTLNTTSPFLSPNEQWREDLSLPFIPWFTTSAGAIVFAMHSIFVQVDNRGTRLFAGLSKNQNASFKGLLASQGVRVSAKVQAGKLIHLALDAPQAMSWGFYLDKQLADSSGLKADGRDGKDVFISCDLVAGETILI